MKQKKQCVDFFMGANSENGFVSHFGQLQNPYQELKAYLLKGGPGTGKSSLMKRLADGVDEPVLEKIHCSSDPDSLDGVMFSSAKAAIVDATSPHVLEPQYAGAVETVVNLLDCVDDEALEREKEEIVRVSTVISGYHRKFCELLKCANVLLDANRKMILPYVDLQKMGRAAERIIKKELQSDPSEIYLEKIRMLSAFTPKGLLTYENSVKTLCKNIYFIHDEYRVCAPVLLELFHQALRERQISCYLCYSPFKAKDELDAVLVPDLDLAFVTVNKYTPMESIEPTKVINVLRFIDPEIFRLKKQRLQFYKKTAFEVLTEGIKSLKAAKDAHDELEAFYIPNVDFSAIDQKYPILQKKITNRLKERGIES